MANCHQLFQDFNQIIRLTENRRQTLLAARNNLRQQINQGFKIVEDKLPSVHYLEFQTQGSFIMDTIINPISEDYDLDDGVYFIGSAQRVDRPETKIFHDFVISCLLTGSSNIRRVTDKDTCVRVMYKEGFSFLFENKLDKIDNSFHVDLPIYYSNSKRSPDLAHLKKSWIVSDPIAFVKWFEDKVQSKFREEFLYNKNQFLNEYRNWRDQIRKDDAQLRKIVRYLKAWCDFIGNEMPCGLILTILAANNYVENIRDDISLKETLVKIQTSLNHEFVCRRPTPPVGEDIFESYEHKDKFRTHLNNFVESAKQAIAETNPKRACAKWQREFGGRFSCSNAADYEENATSFSTPTIISGNAKGA